MYHIKNKIYTILTILLLPALLFAGNKTSDKLEAKVADEINNRYFLESPIHVNATNDGRVELTGTVDNLYYKYHIYDLVANVQGVKEISNQIVVDNELLPDDIIQNNIKNEINYVDLIHEENDINVKVKDGIVHLTGTVSYYYEKKIMNTVATWQRGVRGLVNDIKVRSMDKMLSDKNIENVIDDILANDFPSYQTDINVSVKNGFVDLTGSVDAISVKEELADDIKTLIGVKAINNNINVE